MDYLPVDISRFELPSLQSLEDGPILFHYILPIACLFGGSQFLFVNMMRSFSPSKLFRGLEAKSEASFIHSVFYVMCIISSVAIGEWASNSESWRYDYVECFDGYPNQDHSYRVRFYYTYAIAFYFYSIMDLFFEEKKKDFIAMFAHHVITITIITMSALGNAHRIGVVIMLLFDACDIALEAAKIFNKCKEDTIAAATFVIFVALWIRNRLYMFPFGVLPGIMEGNAKYCEGQIPHYHFMFALLWILLALNIYWSFFIIRKVLLFAKNGITNAKGDPREEQ